MFPNGNGGSFNFQGALTKLHKNDFTRCSTKYNQPLSALSSRLRNGANTTKSTAQNTVQITTCATTSKTSDITTPSGYPPPKETKNIIRETSNANIERTIHNPRKTIRANSMAFSSGLGKHLELRLASCGGHLTIISLPSENHPT